MPEKPKRNKNFEQAAKKPIPETPAESNLQDTWSRDQQQKSYYYDDAYGYEVYHPDEEESEED